MGLSQIWTRDIQVVSVNYFTCYGLMEMYVNMMNCTQKFLPKPIKVTEKR